MICRTCIRSAVRTQPRNFSSPSFLRTPEASTQVSPPARDIPSPAISTGLSQTFSNPLTPSPGTKAKPKSKFVLPDSLIPAGTPLKGLNYIKGREDPVALSEEEYPEWLWKCLEKETASDVDGQDGDDDAFSKSKKLRRKAAKRQRKSEARLEAIGQAPAPKISITRQTIDLPSNAEGSAEGALDAERVREGLRGAMRQERRKGIKEANFLKGM